MQPPPRLVIDGPGCKSERHGGAAPAPGYIDREIVHLVLRCWIKLRFIDHIAVIGLLCNREVLRRWQGKGLAVVGFVDLEIALDRRWPPRRQHSLFPRTRPAER